MEEMSVGPEEPFELDEPDVPDEPDPDDEGVVRGEGEDPKSGVAETDAALLLLVQATCPSPTPAARATRAAAPTATPLRSR
jgi:hypothetical protein